MEETTGRQIVLAARPSGKPRLSDFRLEEVRIPTPRSGQVLLGVQYLSLDPYMRGRMDHRESYAKPLQVGDVMVGEAVARVIASDHPITPKVTSSSLRLDGERTRFPMARAFANWIHRGCRSRPASGCHRRLTRAAALGRVTPGLSTMVAPLDVPALREKLKNIDAAVRVGAYYRAEPSSKPRRDLVRVALEPFTTTRMN